MLPLQRPVVDSRPGERTATIPAASYPATRSVGEKRVSTPPFWVSCFMWLAAQSFSFVRCRARHCEIHHPAPRCGDAACVDSVSLLAPRCLLSRFGSFEGYTAFNFADGVLRAEHTLVGDNEWQFGIGGTQEDE